MDNILICGGDSSSSPFTTFGFYSQAKQSIPNSEVSTFFVSSWRLHLSKCRRYIVPIILQGTADDKVIPFMLRRLSSDTCELYVPLYIASPSSLMNGGDMTGYPLGTVDLSERLHAIQTSSMLRRRFDEEKLRIMLELSAHMGRYLAISSFIALIYCRCVLFLESTLWNSRTLNASLFLSLLSIGVREWNIPTLLY